VGGGFERGGGCLKISDIQLQVRDSESGNQFELGQTLTSVTWTWQIRDQPGKLEFSYLDIQSGQVPQYFYEGSIVVLYADAEKIFDGIVFKRERSHKDTINVTALDMLRYLNNKDVFVFDNHSQDEIFTAICKEHKIPFRIVNPMEYKTSPASHDNKTLYSMIMRALDETFIATQKYIILRDNVGTLELIDIEELKTDILIADNNLITGFDFKSDIDSSTYNYIKLIKDNKDTAKRELYIAMDSANIKKWGWLQYFDKMDEDANESQIKLKADQLLKLYNRKTRTLTITCLGNLKVTAGSGVYVAIKKLENEGIAQMQYCFVSKVTHKISKDIHTMDLQLEII
jgi:hypothetical protein